jgi:hypothetical protein
MLMWREVWKAFNGWVFFLGLSLCWASIKKLQIEDFSVQILKDDEVATLDFEYLKSLQGVVSLVHEVCPKKAGPAHPNPNKPLENCVLEKKKPKTLY